MVANMWNVGLLAMALPVFQAYDAQEQKVMSSGASGEGSPRKSKSRTIRTMKPLALQVSAQGDVAFAEDSDDATRLSSQLNSKPRTIRTVKPSALEISAGGDVSLAKARLGVRKDNFLDRALVCPSRMDCDFEPNICADLKPPCVRPKSASHNAKGLVVGYCKRAMCTCNFWGSNSYSKSVVADDQACADTCSADGQCSFAFFHGQNRKCFLMKSCSYATKIWVGDYGGLTFRKVLSMSRDQDWPEKFFGKYAGLEAQELLGSDAPTWADWGAVSTAATQWNPQAGSQLGYDWTLPDTAQMSKMGRMVTVRTFNLNKYWKNVLQAAPQLTLPGAQTVVEMWIAWKELEPADGVFDFTGLKSQIDILRNRGFKAYLRIMTSDKDKAPSYMAGLVPSADPARVPHSRGKKCPGSRGQPYDIEDQKFHSRYVRLVNEMAAYCQDDVVTAVFVGWMSCSNGDEGIGPSNHGYLDGGEPTSVKERLKAWKQACAGHEHKVVMAGTSRFGLDQGFGIREGFIEMYWYRPPGTADHGSVEGHTLGNDGYVTIDEHSPLANSGTTNADENEEYSPKWSSEWRCARCGTLVGDKGGRWSSDASLAGSQSRWGPVKSFPYRYMMSMLRSLQLRMNMLVLDPRSLVNADISKFTALSLGKTREDTLDAWCFLVSAYTSQGLVKNWERWLTQRDRPGHPKAQLDARFTATPTKAKTNPIGLPPGRRYDYLAKAATEFGFTFDDVFAGRLASASSAWLKVSFFDASGAGSLSIVKTKDGDCDRSQQIATMAMHGTGDLRTATFVLKAATDIVKSARGSGFDFCVVGEDTAGDAHVILVSFVRAILGS